MGAELAVTAEAHRALHVALHGEMDGVLAQSRLAQRGDGEAGILELVAAVELGRRQVEQPGRQPRRRQPEGVLARGQSEPLDEDVAAVGLSILSGSHKELAGEVLEGLRAAGAGDIPVFVGGTVPPQDRAALLEAGVKGVFTNDSPLEQMIEDLARATTKEIRHMLFTLRPLVLETQGLKAALETLVQKLRDTEPDLTINLELDDQVEKLDKDLQGMVFYIVEEAIGNARKHAQARNIWVRTFTEDSNYLIEIRDDGVGFDVAKVQANYDQRGSLGMINMYERAEVMNAKLSIASAPGQGTRVSMRLPLERVGS